MTRSAGHAPCATRPFHLHLRLSTERFGLRGKGTDASFNLKIIVKKAIGAEMLCRAQWKVELTARGGAPVQTALKAARKGPMKMEPRVFISDFQLTSRPHLIDERVSG